MVLQVRLANYCATTKIDPSSCRGFENEAFQALFALVHYVEGSSNQRNAWYRAVWNAHMNTAGTLRAGPANKSFFYSAVLNRKNSAFGQGSAPPAEGVLDAGLYPWALDDPTFNVLNDEVKHGKGLAGGREKSWKELATASDKWRNDHGLSTPVAVAGWGVTAWFVKKYAPELAAWITERSPFIGPAIPLVAYLANDFRNWTVRNDNASARVNFAIDETRRSFDVIHPIFPHEVGGST